GPGGRRGQFTISQAPPNSRKQIGSLSRRRAKRCGRKACKPLSARAGPRMPRFVKPPRPLRGRDPRASLPWRWKRPRSIRSRVPPAWRSFASRTSPIRWARASRISRRAMPTAPPMPWRCSKPSRPLPEPRARPLDFAARLPASPEPTLRESPMPLYALTFPAFDPVLISFGPIAIRWYALAYIVGILLGWLYARATIRCERLWNKPMPLTVSAYDDFVLWVTLGIILGGRIGYVLFYNPGY